MLLTQKKVNTVDVTSVTNCDGDSERAWVAAKWLKARALAGGDEMTEEDKRGWEVVGKNCLTPEDLADLWKWFRR